tara:strand:- start:216 stop:722 length:507 start_codon:yes stop_codon:yes gene_type:complete
MIYLSTATSEQTFTFIPRSVVINARVEVTNEETGFTQVVNTPISSLGNFSAISVALTLVENTFYDLKIISIGSNWDDVTQRWDLLTINWEQGVTNSGAAWNFSTADFNETTGNWDTVRQPKELVIYKDRIFCTNQTISQGANEYYNIDSGVYKVSNSGNNKYKVYTAS